MTTWLTVIAAGLLIVFMTVACFGLAVTVVMFATGNRPRSVLEVSRADAVSSRVARSNDNQELEERRELELPEPSDMALERARDALDGFSARGRPCAPCGEARAQRERTTSTSIPS